MKALLLVLFLLTACFCATELEKHYDKQKQYPFYGFKQCDKSSTWYDDYMQKINTKTVCQVGCLMSSVAMGMNRYGIKLNGKIVDPGVLNEYYRNNNGYVDGNLFVWTKIESATKIKYKNKIYRGGSNWWNNMLSYGDNDDYICIVKMQNRGHWLLVAGVDWDKKRLLVKDPGCSSRKCSGSYAEQTYFADWEVSQMALFDVSAAKTKNPKLNEVMVTSGGSSYEPVDPVDPTPSSTKTGKPVNYVNVRSSACGSKVWKAYNKYTYTVLNNGEKIRKCCSNWSGNPCYDWIKVQKSNGSTGYSAYKKVGGSRYWSVY